jgi:nitrogen fixation/metabolism regulation signal transduction histidine kinase
VHSKDELGELANSFNRMSAELLESRRQLVKAEKDAAWREMAKQVAHEIKNPLTPISLSATLLKRARDERSPDFDSIFERTIELIQRQVEGMRRIAADFSAFAGTHKRTPERIELAELVREVLDLEAAWAEERGVRMESRVEALAVLADRDELRRVLINLVSNAIEAMPDGGALRVRARRQDQHMLLEVEDEGVGLSSEARAHLFEPYFTTRTHGTGLGLAICHQLIEGMGGTIELLDAPGGKGTLARITLPCMA